MSMEKERSKFRILMFPWLAHGHISPFLELSKRLLRTKHFSIYLCSTAVNLDSIRATLEKNLSDDDDEVSITLVELHLPSLPELPPLLQTTKNLPSNLFPTLLKAFQMSSSSFSDILNSVNPDLMIYDFYQPWAPKIASSKGIPSVYFATSGATPFCFYHHVYTMGTASTFPHQAIYLLDHEIINLRNRLSHIKDDDKDFAFGLFTMSSDIVLMKSCSEIEQKYIDYLSVLCQKQIVSTGPLIADANDYADHEKHSEIMKWLSGKNQCSTIYISFGSECFLSKEQIAEIAKGLQLCNVNFLWVIRFPVGEKTTSIEEELPEGFLEIVKERGTIVPGWGPQTKILAHSSIGGFLTHSGWGSITESMYFGVPVITMPMKTDQLIISRLVMEARFGVEVEKDGNGNFKGEDVAKAINKVMVESNEGMRSRAKILSQNIKENDEEKVNEAAEQLLRICMKNKKQV